MYAQHTFFDTNCRNLAVFLQMLCMSKPLYLSQTVTSSLCYSQMLCLCREYGEALALLRIMFPRANTCEEIDNWISAETAADQTLGSTDQAQQQQVRQ